MSELSQQAVGKKTYHDVLLALQSEVESISVLIVEDDEVYAEQLQRQLRMSPRMHYRTASVQSFADAIAVLEKERFDVSLVDIRLGAESGLDLVEYARTRKRITSIIVMTGAGDPEIDEKALHLGADDFLEKNSLTQSMLERSIRYTYQSRRQLYALEELVTELQTVLRDRDGVREQLLHTSRLDSVGRLAAGVAHELKNPLAVVSMGVDYLRKNPSPEPERMNAVVNEMGESLSRASWIAAGLLELSAPRPLDKTQSSVGQIAESAILFTKYEANKVGVMLSGDVDHELPPVDTDRSRLIQVVINLITNAIHASPEGSTIRVSTTRREDDHGAWAVICIEDEGTGIPESSLEKIFDPFFTTKAAGSGTGLGLDICKSIMEQHEGTIQLENMAKGGARATLKLPLR